jgi:hypothetical protein
VEVQARIVVEEVAMTVLIVAIVIAWIVFSTLLVTVACMGSSQISQLEVGRRPRPARPRVRRKREVLPSPPAGTTAAVDL